MDKLVHNVETNEIEYVALTETEIQEKETALLEMQAVEAEAAIKEAARQALLDKLGITADEAKLLLG